MVNGLIAKLLSAGVVSKNDHDVFFTADFSRYLCSYASRDAGKIGTVGGWRRMLEGFNPSLTTISAGEVAATVILLDYHLAMTETPGGNYNKNRKPGNY